MLIKTLWFSSAVCALSGSAKSVSGFWFRMIFYVCPVGGHTCGTSALFFFFLKMGKNSKDTLMENHKARLDPNSWVMFADAPQRGGKRYSVGKNTCKVRNYTINRKSTIKFQEFALSSKSSKVACSGLWRNKSLQSKHFFPPAGTTRHKKSKTAGRRLAFPRPF